jgi:hypothetical protein
LSHALDFVVLYTISHHNFMYLPRYRNAQYFPKSRNIQRETTKHTVSLETIQKQSTSCISTTQFSLLHVSREIQLPAKKSTKSFRKTQSWRPTKIQEESLRIGGVAAYPSSPTCLSVLPMRWLHLVLTKQVEFGVVRRLRVTGAKNSWVG